MKEFEEQLLMILRVSHSILPIDKKDRVENLADEMFASIAELINQEAENGEGYSNIEVVTAVYATLLEVHRIISDSMPEEGELE